MGEEGRKEIEGVEENIGAVEEAEGGEVGEAEVDEGWDLSEDGDGDVGFVGPDVGAGGGYVEELASLGLEVGVSFTWVGSRCNCGTCLEVLISV